MDTASQKFCSECGAQVAAASSSDLAPRFCAVCGKPQYTTPQVNTSIDAVSDATNDATDKASVQHVKPQPKKQGMIAMGVVALSLAIGGASYGTTRLFIEKPIAKPANDEASAGSGGQAAPENVPISPATQQAITRLQDSLAAEPNNKNILLRLANAWYDAGSAYQQQNAVFMARQAFTQSEKLYERFLKEFEPKNVAARIDYAYTLLSQGRADDAIAETKKALEVEPNHAIALYNLGVIYNRKGDATESKKYFNAAIKAAPDSDVAKAAQELLKQLESGS
jgi:tetratricopeptide (TPR) repeat protein/ribosomal protein S27AE